MVMEQSRNSLKDLILDDTMNILTEDNKCDIFGVIIIILKKKPVEFLILKFVI